MNFPPDPVFWMVAALAVILVGLGKGGFAGLGSASMPLMTLVIDPISAAAILLPLFIVQDAVGVWAFRKHYDGRILAWALPGALLGTFLGWLLAASVAIWVVEAAVGAIALLFGINRIAAMRGGGVQASGQQPEYLGIFWGGVSGFTSQIALAGGPPFQIWAMSRRLEQQVFAGTCAIFFAVINWFKVPAFLALGQFTQDNLALSVLLLPLAIASTFAGVALVRRISADRFLLAINLLMIAVGARLLGNGLTAI